MKRIQYHRFGGPEELLLEDVPQAEPGPGQVRVQVRAAAANPMDWKLRQGEMKLLSGSHFPRGLGHDFAGIVEAVGPGARRLSVGDEVMGVATIRAAGAFAESVIAEEKNTTIKPASVPFEQAAASTLVAVTAWTALVQRVPVRAGQNVFIAGCLGGVGRAAVQIARSRGAKVTGSCSAARKAEAVALGVHEFLEYRDFAPGEHPHRFDVVFDTAGGLSFSDCGLMLKKGGQSVHIVPTLAKMLISPFSSRHHLVFGNPTPEALESVALACKEGTLVPAIGSVVPLSRAISAIVSVENTGLPKGKLVVVPDAYAANGSRP